jgi:O-acetyl-ADP-ribose deacetylase (regulator of RNase III)
MNSTIEIWQGDITTLSVDAIVNAANRSLLGGGGVDGAIHRVAGPELLDACRLLHGCQTGEAKITPGFQLPARWVIHTVGPVWQGRSHNEDGLLASCYRNCFQLGKKHELETIAFPAISTGVYGFPLKRATAIAIRETKKQLNGSDFPKKVIFVCFNSETRKAYKEALTI